MSDFPRLHYMLSDSACEVLSGHETVRATNGALRVRRAFTGEKRNWTLLFFLDNTRRDTLDDHYTDNKDAQFSFVWPDDGVTYTASYAGPPQYTREGPDFSRARVVLMER